MTFWTAGAGWVSQFFYEYYLYTGDKDFLAKRALPFMKEAALFYEDFLDEVI
jgi:trehalose/maltose hydrolase-like predicted phosphorylase